MSNIDQITSISNEQLFTELTSEEAAVIEGGAFVLIEKIQAIKANADLVGKDDTYITIGGQKIWGDRGMGTGDSAVVNLGVGFNNQTTVALFDKDPKVLGIGNDDPMGSFTVSGATNGTAIRRVSGSGSTYDVYYQAFA
jgi:hypothetical protein